MSFATDIRELAAPHQWNVQILHDDAAAIVFRMPSGNIHSLLMQRFTDTVEFMSALTAVSWDRREDVPPMLMLLLLEYNQTAKRAYWCIYKNWEQRYFVALVANIPVAQLSPDEFVRSIGSILPDLDRFTVRAREAVNTMGPPPKQASLN